MKNVLLFLVLFSITYFSYSQMGEWEKLELDKYKVSIKFPGTAAELTNPEVDGYIYLYTGDDGSIFILSVTTLSKSESETDVYILADTTMKYFLKEIVGEKIKMTESYYKGIKCADYTYKAETNSGKARIFLTGETYYFIVYLSPTYDVTIFDKFAGSFMFL